MHHILTSKSGLGLGKKPVLKEMLIIANYNSDETEIQNVQLHAIFLLLVPGSARVSMVMSIILVRGHSRGRFEGEATPLTRTSIRPHAPSPSRGINDRLFCIGWIYAVA